MDGRVARVLLLTVAFVIEGMIGAAVAAVYERLGRHA